MYSRKKDKEGVCMRAGVVDSDDIKTRNRKLHTFIAKRSAPLTYGGLEEALTEILGNGAPPHMQRFARTGGNAVRHNGGNGDRVNQTFIQKRDAMIADILGEKVHVTPKRELQALRSKLTVSLAEKEPELYKEHLLDLQKGGN